VTRLFKRLATAFVFTLISPAYSQCTESVSPDHPDTQLKQPYRLIYNMDTSGILPASKGIDHYLTGVAGFLTNSHVDTVFWMDGAGGNVVNYESEVLERKGERIGKLDPVLDRFIREGNDPPRRAIKAIRNQGVAAWFSFRLNDPHDSLGHENLVASFKLKHPDWTIGKGHPYGGHLQLNFAIQEVQDLKFLAIAEIFEKYDFDGLEVDFLRSPPYFVPGKEPENAHHLTRFLQRVREHLHEVGRQRGRPVSLAVRVGETLEVCRLDGFDVKTWIQERLCDMIVLGSGTIDIDIPAFKQLTAGTGILVYPCLYGWPSKYNPISTDLARGIAANYHQQGADGIYTFNWNAHSYAHDPEGKNQKWKYMVSLLREIDDTKSLLGKNIRFAADRGRPTRIYPHNWSHCILPTTIHSGEQKDIPIQVGVDFQAAAKPEKILLVLDGGTLAGGTRLSVKVNGKSADVTPRVGRYYKGEVSPDQLRPGRNIVNLLVERGTLDIHALELDVQYTR